MSELIDTSVWVDHFKRRNEVLVEIVLHDDALTHPMVLVELACGTPPTPSERTLGDIRRLRPATRATFDEVLDFIEQERLYGLGCGLVDITLLTSALMTAAGRLWTLDQRLAGLAARFGIAFNSDR